MPPRRWPKVRIAEATASCALACPALCAIRTTPRSTSGSGERIKPDTVSLATFTASATGIVAAANSPGVLTLLHLRGGVHRTLKQRLSVPTGCGCILHPVEDQAVPILEVEFGIAGCDGDTGLAP